MQAITVAISPNGVEFFASQVLAGAITSHLTNLKPSDQSFSVGTVNVSTYDWYTGIGVQLTNGSLVDFSPSLSSVVQQANGAFVLTFVANNFKVQYTWKESGSETRMTDRTSVNVPYNPDPFTYQGPVQSLTIGVTVQFQFDSGQNAWEVAYCSTTATPRGVSNTIPSQSVVKILTEGCTTDAAASAIQAGLGGIDFHSLVGNAMPALIDSIPDSGKLTPDITFVFGLGDSGLTFPNNVGIGIGATGAVTWTGQSYPGTPPTGLPVPVSPTDGHHLQMYVSDFEFNALYWAFYKDQKLAFTVQPSDLQNPEPLKVATYTASMPSLKPWQFNSMEATVTPKAAPTVTFTTVYEVTTPLMAVLKSTLPDNVYAALTDLQGFSYTSQSAFETDMTSAGNSSNPVVNMQPYFAAIEQAAKSMGAVVTHDLQLVMTILNTASPSPFFSFEVKRTDILENLVLGVAGSAQTVQFSFAEVNSSASFLSSNIPNFDGQQIGTTVWPLVGDTEYTNVLNAMGKNGVALPIMQGFQFLFQHAVLNLEQDFVSVLANVQFTTSGASAAGGSK